MLLYNDLIFLIHLKLKFHDWGLQLLDASVEWFYSFRVSLPELLGFVVVAVIKGTLLDQALYVAARWSAFYLDIIHPKIIFYY